MTTGGQGRPNTVMLRWNANRATTFLGLPDVYADEFAAGIDQSADTQCTQRKDDPLVLGYFIGNEPPWGDRESEVVDMILKGPDTATKAKLKEFLAQGDTSKRRKQFVVAAFEHYLNLVCSAVRKYDPNHLNLGIRFGGKPADEVMRWAALFDVCSINVYEYEPTKQLDRAYRLTGRPILIGEFHIGVPENGLGSGLVQAMNQAERGNGYRYYVEQAASMDCFLGAHWFQWQRRAGAGPHGRRELQHRLRRFDRPPLSRAGRRRQGHAQAFARRALGQNAAVQPKTQGFRGRHAVVAVG